MFVLIAGNSLSSKFEICPCFNKLYFNDQNEQCFFLTMCVEAEETSKNTQKFVSGTKTETKKQWFRKMYLILS